ncbi:MAG: HAD family hydrolase [Hyphomicrobiales bacterium]
MRKIAFFDFDGTLYKKDSTITFCLYCYKKKPFLMWFLCIQTLYLCLHKLKLVSIEVFKEKFFGFLNYIAEDTINKLLEGFWDKEINKSMNNDIVGHLQRLKKNGAEIFIISASPEFLLEKPKEKLGAHILLGTKMNVKPKVKIKGKNCRGIEKKVRLEEYINTAYCIIEGYSDNYDDDHLLSISERSVKL